MRKGFTLLLILLVAPYLWHVQAADPNPPRLIETLYRARLVDGSLEGSATWKIINPNETPGVLAIQPLGIAVRRSAWRGGGEAILGNLQGTLSLLVELAGEANLELDWSARSSPVAGGLRFSLDVPACAMGFLELELPTDRAVSVSRETYHLAGPLPVKTADHQLWRIGFSGRSQVNFMVRRVSGPGIPAPLVLSRLQTRQTLTPGELEADYDFELEVLHGGVSKLICNCDAGLRPYQVQIRNLEDWSLKAGKTPTGPNQLHIRLRDPFVGGPLQIKCLASVTPNATWSSPGIRLADGVSRDEILTLQVDPEIQLEDWQPGGFHLLRSSVDGKGHNLTVSAGIEAGANPVRPRAKLATPGPEYDVRQLTWWELAPDRQKLTTRLEYSVTRGRLFRLPLQLPAGWEVEQVGMFPADRLSHWTTLTDKAKSLLMVELQRSLDPTATARLTVRLRREPTARGMLSFPDVIPLGARQREGALGISLSSAYQATVSSNVPQGTAGPDFEQPRPPWGKQTLDYHYPFQGRAVEGTLTLRPRAMQVRAACGQDVAVASGRALVVTRLELAPEVGAPQHVDLFISGADIGAWAWRTLRGGNAVERMERRDAVRFTEPLKLLAAQDGLQAVALASQPRLRGSWWRLLLAQPLTEPLVLEARVELTGRESVAALAVQVAPFAGRQPFEVASLVPAATLADGPLQRRIWELPLLCVLDAERLEGTVTLHLTGADLVQIETLGLREVASGRSAAKRPAATPWRTYRFSQLPLALTLRSDRSGVDPSREAVIDAAELTSYLEPPGRLVHHFRFRIRDWRQQTLPIRLPANLQLLAVRSDGAWVTRLPPLSPDGPMVEFALPVPGRESAHQYELLYTSAAEPFSLWRELTAPVPDLPVEPLALERSWFLPPGVTPLLEDGVRQRPSSARSQKWLPDPLDSFAGSADWQTAQEQEVTEAILAVRKEHPAGDAWSLGQLLEGVAIRHLKNRATLVLDTEALGDLAALPSSTVPAEAWEATGTPWSPKSFPLPVPWESMGLAYLPCRSAPVLTSRTQQLLWEEDTSAIEQAVAEAARHGQDRSGRFRRLTEWLEQGSADNLDLPDQLATSHESWTEWQPLPGVTDPGNLLVICPDSVPLAGIVLGVMLALTAVRLGPQPGRRRFRLFLVWLAVGGLGLLWLPAPLRPLAWGPALVGIAVGLIWCIRLALRLRRAVAAAASAAGLMLAVASGSGAAPSTVSVFPTNDPGPAQLLLPPARLAQLQDAGPAGARLLTADYRGKIEGNQAIFEARFSLQSFDEEPVSLTVPLSGVQLLDAFLNDEATQPVRVDGGYSLRIGKAGRQHLLLRFTVLLPIVSEERDLRFGVPELPQSRFTLEAPQPASYLHVVDARGSQKVTVEGTQARLEADLGAVPAIRVRWRHEEAQAPSKPKAVSIREAYYWELKPSSARLLAVLQYHVSKGWLSRAVIELPRELEVASLEAGPLPGGQPAPRLKDWTLRSGDGPRRLEVEFAGPVTASVQVTLELVPRQPLGRVANLPFPTPLDGQLSRGFLGYRLEDLAAPAGPEKALAITGMAREEQEPTFTEWFAIPWGVARQEKVPPPNRFFWRMKGGVLQLTLQPDAGELHCRQEIVWRVDSAQATLQAKLHLGPRLGLVQWEVPAGLMIADLDGPHLAQWTRSGNRIQAWLRQPMPEASETSLQLSGWLPHPPKAPRFDIPLVRVLGAAKQQTALRIVAGYGADLSPGKLVNLTAQPEGDIPGQEWNFTTSQDSYGGSFALVPATANASCQLLTFAEVRDHQFVFDGTAICTVQRGQLRRLNVSVRHWPTGTLTLSAPNAVKVEERKLAGDGRAWWIELPAGVTGSYELKVSGRLPLEAFSEVRMPDMRIDAGDDGPLPQQRWLGVAGTDLEARGISGLEAVSNWSAALRHWPREADRLRRAGGTAWQVQAEDWRLRLSPRGPAAVAPVRLLLAEYEAAASNRQRWLHRVTYRLAHEGGADLVLSLRDGARILGVHVNGVPAPPLLQPGGNRLWLPLPGGPGQQSVEVLWSYPEGSEPIHRPILESPLLEGIAVAAVVWKIQVPLGYQLRPEKGPPYASSAACLDLSRAAATLQFMAWLGDQPGADPRRAAAFATANAGFERHLRFAEYRLSLADDSDDLAALTAWLAELRQQRAQLEQQPGIRALRETAKDPPPGDEAVVGQLGLAPFEEGRPAYWYGAGMPPLRLVSEESSRLRQTATLSVLLAALLFASWILATIFGAVAWPEQLGLLGVLGWLIFGGPAAYVFLVLPVIWLLVRLLHLVLRAWSWLPRRPAATPAGLPQ